MVQKTGDSCPGFSLESKRGLIKEVSALQRVVCSSLCVRRPVLSQAIYGPMLTSKVMSCWTWHETARLVLLFQWKWISCLVQTWKAFLDHSGVPYEGRDIYSMTSHLLYKIIIISSSCDTLWLVQTGSPCLDQTGDHFPYINISQLETSWLMHPYFCMEQLQSHPSILLSFLGLLEFACP